jgi:hypothetical protein
VSQFKNVLFRFVMFGFSANVLLGYLESICDAGATGDIVPVEWAQLCGAVWRGLGPLLTHNFIVAAAFVPALRRVSSFRQQLGLFLDSMTLCCADSLWSLILVVARKIFVFVSSQEAPKEMTMTHLAHNCVSSIREGADIDLVHQVLESSPAIFDAFFSLPKCHFLVDDFSFTKDIDLKVLLAHVDECLWNSEKRTAECEREVEGVCVCLFESGFCGSQNLAALHVRVVAQENRLVRFADMILSRDASKV